VTDEEKEVLARAVEGGFLDDMLNGGFYRGGSACFSACCWKSHYLARSKLGELINKERVPPDLTVDLLKARWRALGGEVME